MTKKLINRRLQCHKVYKMNGDPVCTVPARLSKSELRAIMLTSLNVFGAVAEAMELVPVQGSGNNWQVVFNASTFVDTVCRFDIASDQCEACASLVFELLHEHLNRNDACDFCTEVCCDRCVHTWRSDRKCNDTGVAIEPGMRICVKCIVYISRDWLEAEGAHVSCHFQFAARAWRDMDSLVENSV